MKYAADKWKEFGDEIKAGKRKAFLDHLEERCLVNQVVGSVFSRGNLFLHDPTASIRPEYNGDCD